MIAAFLSQTAASRLPISPHTASLPSRKAQCSCKRRRHAPALSADGSGQGDSDDSGETELSRRVFLGGIATTAAATGAVGYRLVVGEDVESRVYARIKQRFPRLFPRESTADERRRPLDAAFAARYVAAVGAVAAEMGLVTPGELAREEMRLRERAFRLFFSDGPVRESLGSAPWLNFVLYARLHVIEARTSPATRLEFGERFYRRTLREFRTRVGRGAGDARAGADVWLGQIRALLEELVEHGWISGFRVEEFDGGPGSGWMEEGRGSLTVYANDPVTMQVAQLIGGEEFEEIAPKVSGWIHAVLMEWGIRVTLEDYYLDDHYRPDPEQFRPSQLATQFDLTI